MASAAPRYGAWMIKVWLMSLNISPAKYGDEPLPKTLQARLTRIGADVSDERISRRSQAGWAYCDTTSTRAAPATSTRSLTRSINILG
jgi:hypothetical protein